ncbi:MAG: hypothetical protein KatS3mg108_3752 [Isosphaeraceae bacterium]|jgi:hypothetical protein|nr:MAG: hypothetical protein KatS3mg108_3752 [Isosphaeraceae bacterium]
MAGQRERRRVVAYRPTLEGSSHRLEPRLVLSRMVPLVRAASLIGRRHAPPVVFRPGVDQSGLPQSPKPYVQTGVLSGGAGAMIVDVDGELWTAIVTGGGTVRAKAAPDGRVDLTLFGTRPNSVLSINPSNPTPGREDAHRFAYGTGIQDGLVHVRNITVVNGRINQIVGYKTATLSGTLKVALPGSPKPEVDRVALYELRPGAAVEIAGDLNTLDVFNTVTLVGGRGIRIGRDLNWFNTGGTLNLQDGAAILVGRDIGLAPQGAKGTGPAGQGGLIRGDLILGTGSTIAVGRFVDAPIVVQGSSSGIANLPANVASATTVLGTRG